MTEKKSGRYAVPADEDYEPGSNNEVLKNYLSIKSQSDMEVMETKELERAEEDVSELFTEDHKFTADNVCKIHELWLANIYPFAGKYRTVNMAKGGFSFAAASRVEALMFQLERNFLAKYTPCNYSDMKQLAYALGIVHVEFILIHPFREGNGRVARLLADLMAMQAKMPPLNYASIDQTENPQGFDRYILAIHASVDENYEPIVEIFKRLLEQTI